MNNQDQLYLVLYVLKHILLLEYIFILMISPHQLLCAGSGLSPRARATVPWCRDCSAAAFPLLFGNPRLRIDFVIIRVREQCFRGPRISCTSEVVVYVLKHYYKLNSMISATRACLPAPVLLSHGAATALRLLCSAISVCIDHASASGSAVPRRSDRVRACLLVVFPHLSC